MPDFAGGQVDSLLFDAWVNTSASGISSSCGAGKFKTPFSLERLQQGQFVLFNERKPSSRRARARSRHVGVDIHGDAFNSALIWDLAVLDGTAPDGGSVDVDNNYGKDFVAAPFRRIRCGRSRTAGSTTSVSASPVRLRQSKRAPPP